MAAGNIVEVVAAAAAVAGVRVVGSIVVVVGAEMSIGNVVEVVGSSIADVRVVADTLPDSTAAEVVAGSVSVEVVGVGNVVVATVGVVNVVEGVGTA